VTPKAALGRPGRCTVTYCSGFGWAVIGDCNKDPLFTRFPSESVLLSAVSSFLLFPSPAGLPNTQCHSSLHHWHPCSSFLVLRSLRFLLRIVAWRGNGYAYCHVFRPLHDLMVFCVKSFNSLGQNACTVAANMMATCNGGCESNACLFCLASADLIVLSLLKRSPSMRCSRDTGMSAQAALMTPTCASAALSDIHS
jgi:hypothetical protein